MLKDSAIVSTVQPMSHISGTIVLGHWHDIMFLFKQSFTLSSAWLHSLLQLLVFSNHGLLSSSFRSWQPFFGTVLHQQSQLPIQSMIGAVRHADNGLCLQPANTPNYHDSLPASLSTRIRKNVSVNSRLFYGRFYTTAWMSHTGNDSQCEVDKSEIVTSSSNQWLALAEWGQDKRPGRRRSLGWSRAKTSVGDLDRALSTRSWSIFYNHV